MDPLVLDLPFADLTALRARARALRAVAEETRRLAAVLDNRVRSTPYQGPSAGAFRLRMTAHHAEALRISSELAEIARRLATPPPIAIP